MIGHGSDLSNLSNRNSAPIFNCCASTYAMTFPLVNSPSFKFGWRNKTKTGNPWTDYQAALLSLKDKDDAIDFATGETVRTLTIDTKTKEVEMPSDGIPGQLFKHPTTKEYFLIDKDGKPQPINLNKYLKNLKLA